MVNLTSYSSLLLPQVFAIAVAVAVLCKKREHFESEEEREIKSRDYQEWNFFKKGRRQLSVEKTSNLNISI